MLTSLSYQLNYFIVCGPQIHRTKVKLIQLRELDSTKKIFMELPLLSIKTKKNITVQIFKKK